MQSHSPLRGKGTQRGIVADEAVQAIPDLQPMFDGLGHGGPQVVRQAIADHRDTDEERVRACDDAVGNAVHDGDRTAEAENILHLPPRLATVEDGSDVGRRVPDDRMSRFRRRRTQLVLRVDEVTRHAINQMVAGGPAKRCRLAARRTSGIFNSNSPSRGNTMRRLVSLSLVLLPAAVAAQNRSPSQQGSAIRVGPEHGTVIVVGGGAMGPEVYSAFIKAAGGPDALIVDVPTAGGDTVYTQNAPGTRGWKQAGARNVYVLHANDKKLADSDSFAAILKKAGGVWFEGGRQFHLVDSYGGTKTEKAFHDVLARGGVSAARRRARRSSATSCTRKSPRIDAPADEPPITPPRASTSLNPASVFVPA